jgi:hypothetical protein
MERVAVRTKTHPGTVTDDCAHAGVADRRPHRPRVALVDADDRVREEVTLS